MSSNTTFLYFPLLPFEIRCMIWALCLPHRVVDIVLPNHFSSVEEHCTYVYSLAINNTPPTIWAVNREARNIAFKYYGNHTDNQRRVGDLAPLVLIRVHQTIDGLLADTPGTWFSPSRDIPVLYHFNEEVLTGAKALIRGRAQLYGYIAKDTAIFAPHLVPNESWPSCNVPGREPLHGLQLLQLPEWRDPLVVLEIITIHASEGSARRSGLFGFLGDEHVQLVNSLDTERLKAYYRFLVKSRARRRQASSDEWLLKGASSRQRYRDIPQWLERARVREVWRLWLLAREKGFEGVSNPRDIWDGPRVWKNRTLDMLDPDTYSLGDQEFEGLDARYFRPNKNHPWVQSVLAGLPSFRLRVMIRHCPTEVCLNDPPAPGYWDLLRNGDLE